MPEVLAQLWSFPGLPILIIGVFVAGVARGFTGFGAALVYMPIATQYMPPVWAILTLVMMEVLGPIPVFPQAIRDADRPVVARLSIAAVVVLPLGLWALTRLDPVVFRYAVCGLTLVVPLLLASGWRLKQRLSPLGQVAVGGASGFLGGIAGLPGPPVILTQLAQSLPTHVIRANLIVFFLIFDLATIAFLGIAGHMAVLAIALALVLSIPNLLGILVGNAMFHPERQRIYRWVGYTMMGLAGLTGLPVWDA